MVSIPLTLNKDKTVTIKYVKAPLLPSSITCSVSPTSVQAGGSVTASGKLTVSGSDYTGYIDILVDNQIVQSGIPASPNYSALITFAAAGTYSVKARFNGTPTVSPSESSAVTVTVTTPPPPGPTPTAVTISVSSQNIPENTAVWVTGKLTSGGAGVLGKIVKIFVTGPQSFTRIALPTLPDGTYPVLPIVLPTAGTYYLTAKFEGDATYAPSTSPTVYVNVWP